MPEFTTGYEDIRGWSVSPLPTCKPRMCGLPKRREPGEATCRTLNDTNISSTIGQTLFTRQPIKLAPATDYLSVPT